MNGKVARTIRSAMKAQGTIVTGEAKYFGRVAKKVMAYVQNEKGEIEAKPVDRLVIINETKNKYRKVKKALKAQRRNGLAA